MRMSLAMKIAAEADALDRAGRFAEADALTSRLERRAFNAWEWLKDTTNNAYQGINRGLHNTFGSGYDNTDAVREIDQLVQHINDESDGIPETKLLAVLAKLDEARKLANMGTQAGQAEMKERAQDQLLKQMGAPNTALVQPSMPANQPAASGPPTNQPSAGGPPTTANRRGRVVVSGKDMLLLSGDIIDSLGVIQQSISGNPDSHYKEIAKAMQEAAKIMRSPAPTGGLEGVSTVGKSMTYATMSPQDRQAADQWMKYAWQNGGRAALLKAFENADGQNGRPDQIHASALLQHWDNMMEQPYQKAVQAQAASAPTSQP